MTRYRPAVASTCVVVLIAGAWTLGCEDDRETPAPVTLNDVDYSGRQFFYLIVPVDPARINPGSRGVCGMVRSDGPLWRGPS